MARGLRYVGYRLIIIATFIVHVHVHVHMYISKHDIVSTMGIYGLLRY